MFLIGGPEFSGTTLLALLLNQGSLVCLDEPDFHDPLQSHRGIPVLESLFPSVKFPQLPGEPLDFPRAVELVRECEKALCGKSLGFKTCNYPFIEYARIYRKSRFPVICIVRDIRDAMVRELPSWSTEETVNGSYRHVWENLSLCDLWFRYEELVADPESVMNRISGILGCPLEGFDHWDPGRVHPEMFKLTRHQSLESGRLSCDRVGIWKTSGKHFSQESHETARLMGY
jgi:hypothetical protein